MQWGIAPLQKVAQISSLLQQPSHADSQLSLNEQFSFGLLLFWESKKVTVIVPTKRQRLTLTLNEQSLRTCLT